MVRRPSEVKRMKDAMMTRGVSGVPWWFKFMFCLSCLFGIGCIVGSAFLVYAAFHFIMKHW
jgi:hypothetical protein